jgi:hypothetical protein
VFCSGVSCVLVGNTATTYSTHNVWGGLYEAERLLRNEVPAHPFNPLSECLCEGYYMINPYSPLSRPVMVEPKLGPAKIHKKMMNNALSIISTTATWIKDCDDYLRVILNPIAISKGKHKNIYNKFHPILFLISYLFSLQLKESVHSLYVFYTFLT